MGSPKISYGRLRPEQAKGEKRRSQKEGFFSRAGPVVNGKRKKFFRPLKKVKFKLFENLTEYQRRRVWRQSRKELVRIRFKRLDYRFGRNAWFGDKSHFEAVATTEKIAQP
ncbi:glycolate oxidase [Firmicutes bacterium M10-2]|nr:glycolate oxidase [Firmicutes bacterium M10-2]